MTSESTEITSPRASSEGDANDTNDWLTDEQLRPYMQELRHQWKACELTATRWNKIITSKSRQGVTEWFSLAQSLLSQGAMAAKIVWPHVPGIGDPCSPERRDWLGRRGASIRHALDLDYVEESPLSKAVRNSFEHFDERLDEYLRAHPDATLVDLNIAPAGAFEIAGVSEKDYLRHIDPVGLSVSVLGKSIAVQDIVNLVAELGNRAEAWLGAARTRRQPC